jgi:hypothetical protein
VCCHNEPPRSQRHCTRVVEVGVAVVAEGQRWGCAPAQPWRSWRRVDDDAVSCGGVRRCERVIEDDVGTHTRPQRRGRGHRAMQGE